jgi:hypothetical protein
MWACPELDTYKKEFTLFLFFRRVSGFVQQAKYTGQKKLRIFLPVICGVGRHGFDRPLSDP